MPPVVYSVCATLPGEDLARDYVAWLTEGHPSHIGRVLEGGAIEGSAWREVGASGRPRVMARYVFPSREAFDRYVLEVAPALRAERAGEIRTPDRRFHGAKRIGSSRVSPMAGLVGGWRSRFLPREADS